MENNELVPKKKWYNQTVFVVLWLVFFAPVGIYGLWKSNRIKKNWKIVWSVVFGCWFTFIVFIPKDTDTTSQSKTSESELIAQDKKALADAQAKTDAELKKSTDIWRVGHYVDDFGEPTKEGFVTNDSHIKGTFSNTATQDSELDVDFLISNSSKIYIQLYEYAGDNPVKAYSSTNYRVLLQDNDKNRFELTATNYSDRLSFNKSASEKIHAALLKGGTVKFKIIESETPTTEYDFTIDNADHYDKAYKTLTNP